MAKKIITKKQQTILTLLLTFRFINSKQVQQFLHHKDHRRINSWLKALVEKEYIERDFKPVFGTLTKPATYFLAAKGRKYVKEAYYLIDAKYLSRIRGNNKRSKAFQIRCQVLVDFYLITFEEYYKDFPNFIEEILINGIKLKYNQFYFFTPAFYSELDFVLLPHLKPDAYVYKKGKTGIIHSCIYIIDAYVPRLTLQYMVRNIFKALDEEYWEDDDISSLQIFIICPNNMVIIYLKRFIKALLENYYGSKPLIFHFVTRNQLYNRRKYNTYQDYRLK